MMNNKFREAASLRNEFEEEAIPRWFIISQIVLRICAILSTIVSIIVMATTKTSFLLGGLLRMDARFYYSSAFKVLMGVDAAVCATVLVSLVALYFILKKEANRNHWYLMFLHDLIMMVLMISASGGATAIGYVGMYGQPKTLWYKICNNVQKFCINVGVSVLFSYIAFFCLLTLTIMSSYLLVKPFSIRHDS